MHPSLARSCAGREKDTGGHGHAEYDAVKDKHTTMQTALASAEDLVQTLLTGLASTSAQSASGGGYIGQIVDARAQLAQAAAEERAQV
jgi:structural maintenance of chromosome 2